MITATLQCLTAVLKLCFGAAALRTAHLTRAEGVRSTAWYLAGVVFTLAGVNSVLHTGWAFQALLAGPGAASYEAFLRWAPAANYSRHVMMLLMALLLLGLPLLHRLPRVSLGRGVLALVVLGGVAGAWAGSLEGPGGRARHYVTTAALDSAEMILLAVALLASLALGTMDRLLWIALAVYAARQAINVVSYSAIAWIQVPGAWSPSPQHIAWIGAVHWALLLWLAARRLGRAARGERTPALLEPAARGAQPSLF